MEKEKMPVKYTKVNPQKLVQFSTRALEKVGLSTENAAVTANLLVNTDLRGIASHGVAHLGPLYVKGIKDGLINSKPDIKISSGAPATAVMDGDHGLGFVVGHRAMAAVLRSGRRHLAASPLHPIPGSHFTMAPTVFPVPARSSPVADSPLQPYSRSCHPTPNKQ